MKVERGAAPTNGERSQPALGRADAEQPKAGGATEAKNHGDQGLLMQ